MFGRLLVYRSSCIFRFVFFFHNFGEDIKFIESDFYGRFGLTLSELIPTPIATKLDYILEVAFKRVITVYN